MTHYLIEIKDKILGYGSSFLVALTFEGWLKLIGALMAIVFYAISINNKMLERKKLKDGN